MDTSEIEATENESVKNSAKKPGRKRKPISDESESTEESDIRRKIKPADNIIHDNMKLFQLQHLQNFQRNQLNQSRLKR